MSDKSELYKVYFYQELTNFLFILETRNVHEKQIF